MAKINTVLFDFDGTLANTNDLILRSWQHTFRFFEGRERPAAEIVKTFGEPLAVTLENALPGIDAAEAMEVYRRFHAARFEEAITLFPGMAELLMTLHARGYKLGLVTSRRPGTTALGLEKFDIKKYFGAIVTCDDTEKHKPDPAPVFAALAKLDSIPAESVLLGDTMFDILCAKNAGVRSVLVGWTTVVGAAERSGANAPDFIMETADALLDFLEC